MTSNDTNDVIGGNIDDLERNTKKRKYLPMSKEKIIKH